MNEELQKTWQQMQETVSLPQSISVLQIGVYLMMGGVLAVYLRLLYRRCGASASDADSITRVFPLLTIITTGVIAVVKSSLALSLGLVGALSIVRFRAAIKEPEELVYLFLCIAVGLSLGAEQPLLAVALVVVASIFVVGMHFFGGRGRQQRMMLTVSGDSSRYFADSKTNALSTVQAMAGRCTVHRLDIENGRGQLRVMLPRSDARDINQLVVKLRNKLTRLRVFLREYGNRSVTRDREGMPRCQRHSKELLFSMIAAVESRNNLPRFQVVDSSASRPDLVKRKEIKFAVPRADVAKLRQVFTGSCRCVAHNEAVSTVRSVYFDDTRLSALRANLDGLGRRRKLRLRWYDSLLPRKEFFLEVKWRNNRVTGKHRFQVNSNISLANLSYREIFAELQQSLPAQHQPTLMTYCDPIVLVEYKREHFHARDGGLRLTIDYDVAYYDQIGKRGVSTAFRQPLHDLVVVEGKTPVGRERELRDLLYPFASRAARCSKYVQGCQMLGLLAAHG